ncbi:sulfotransferase family protein [Magnetococcales bacterium HHB-1]
MRKVNFFILGAPKCGTTSMTKWLAEHPSFYMSAPKEPHFFNTDIGNGIQDLQTYQQLFSAATKQHQVICEASTGYLSSTTAVANILQYNPDARFAVMVRNPIEQVYSYYNFRCLMGDETLQSFAEAWHRQARRAAGLDVPLTCAHAEGLQYGLMCKTGHQLQRVYAQVDKKHVHVIVFDDLKSNAQQVYQQVLNFLDLADDHRQDFTVHNRAQGVRLRYLRYVAQWLILKKQQLGLPNFHLGLLGMIDRKTRYVRALPPMDEDLRQRLIDYFREDVLLLAQLLERNLDHWLQ